MARQTAARSKPTRKIIKPKKPALIVPPTPELVVDPDTDYVKINYYPRPQMRAYHERKQRWSVIVAHRRYGKTVGCVNDLVKAALECTLPEPRYAYVAPTYGQAKDIAWNYLRFYTSTIPGAIPHESELRVDLPNGGRVRLYGSDNYDRMRGIYLDGVIQDEFGDQDPRSWTEVIRPALSDRKGWATFIGTPRGDNHFRDMWDQAQLDDAWFKLMLKASQTGILDEQELSDARKSMTPEQYAAEYECSFYGSVIGAYYGAELDTLEGNGGIGTFGHLPQLAVNTAWDVGNTTAIWLYQNDGSEVRVIDYIEGLNQRPDYYVRELKNRPYTYGTHILPSDATDEKEIVAISWKTALEGLQLPGTYTVLPKQRSIDDGINTARFLVPRCRFNKTTTTAGVTGLRNYRREWDDKRKTFRDVPRHDWASHPADGFRHLALGNNQSIASSNWSKPITYKTQWVV